MRTNTPAEVLAEYLGLNEKTHPWCYKTTHTCSHCKAVVLSSRYSCQNCGGSASRFDATHILALPNPFAPGHEADVWLGVLVRSEKFGRIYKQGIKYVRYVAQADSGKRWHECDDENPTPAIVRAMMAADPEFEARMEGAMG